MDTQGVSQHPLAPVSLLRRFADDAGRLLAERRDRGRRAIIPVEEAAARAGAGAVGPDLAGVLATLDARADGVIGQILGGGFPPRGADRASLALFAAVHLLLGRGYREGLARVAVALGELIEARLGELDVELEVEPAADRADPAGGEADAVRRTLAVAPRLAGFLSARTWQVVRFPRRLLLTSDTPVALWSRPGTVKPHQFGWATADEVRMPLDPRHGLVLARRAPAGEVIRDLDDRHARALNRTMAEAAQAWMLYHPESDPLEGVALAPP